MNDNDMPPLVAAVEAVLGVRVVSLRYLPSPSASAEAMAGRPSERPENPGEVAFNNVSEMGVAQSDLGGVPRSAQVELTPDDEVTG